MILSTHAIVGGALASLMPSHPIAAFAAGFVSHFVIDSIPHWDYPLKSISFGPSARNDGRFTAARLRDLAVIGLVSFVGLVLAIGIFASGPTRGALLAGAIGGMFPDPMQFVCTFFRREPLATFQRFHGWMHSKRQL